LRAILAEIIHLFVDDGSLALALMLWCGAVGLTPGWLPLSPAASGLALFAGCAGILLANVVRTARRA